MVLFIMQWSTVSENGNITLSKFGFTIHGFTASFIHAKILSPEN